MKFKIDQNLPAEFAALLRGGGFEAHSVDDEWLGGADYAVILERVRAESLAEVLPPEPPTQTAQDSAHRNVGCCHAPRSALLGPALSVAHARPLKVKEKGRSRFERARPIIPHNPALNQAGIFSSTSGSA